MSKKRRNSRRVHNEVRSALELLTPKTLRALFALVTALLLVLGLAALMAGGTVEAQVLDVFMLRFAGG